MAAKLTEKQVIRALNRLSKGMPDDLWLLHGGPRGLHLMQMRDGEPVLIDGDPDQEFIVETFDFFIDSTDW